MERATVPTPGRARRVRLPRMRLRFAVAGGLALAAAAIVASDLGGADENGRAAVYRAMAKIPGVALDKKTVDVAGRPALAVSMIIEGYIRQEVLLDRASYAYLGERSVVTKNHTGDDAGIGTVKKGTIDVFSVRLAAAFVDQPGRLP
jgi:hypothetical protein